jgi:hypothetical protein
MQLHKIKTALIRFVSQGSKRSVDLKSVKKSKAAPPNKCVWDLEKEG